jgi:negative regulator of sigma E activity
MKFTDQELSAYLDGELAEDEACALEAALQADPGLREALARLQSVDAILSDTLGGLAEEPVPDHIAALIKSDTAPEAPVEAPAKAPAQLVSMAAWKTRWSAWALPTSLAASLLFGMLIGAQILAPAGYGVDQRLLAGPVVPGTNLHAALETTSSGESANGFVPALSFASENGVCREVRAEAQRGLACRDDAGWTMLVVTPDGQPVGDAGYRTASAETSIVFDILADQLMTEAPMSAEVEAERIENRWRDPGRPEQSQ